MAVEGERRLERLAGQRVLAAQVPLALLGLPAVAHRAARHAQLAARLVEGEELPLGVLLAAGGGEAGGAQHLAAAVAGRGAVAVAPAPLARPPHGLQLDDERPVGVALHVVAEVGHPALDVALAEQHVADRHPEGAVLPLVDRDPLVGHLRGLREVGREHHHLGAGVARLDQEVGVRRAGAEDVRADDGDEARLVPVGALADVGLLAPDLRRRRRQVAVPVVERQADAAEQLQEAGAGGVADHRHRRDRREADHPVRAVVEHRAHVGGGEDLVRLLPGDAAQAALAARLLVAAPRLRVADDRAPGGHRVAGMAPLGRAPQVDQHAAHVGVLHPQRAVDVPGVGDAALAAARLVGGQLGIEARVVERLQLPGDDALLDVDVPAAAAGAVDAVGRAHDLVVGPAVAVEVLPRALLRGEDVLDPAHPYLLLAARTSGARTPRLRPR